MKLLRGFEGVKGIIFDAYFIIARGIQVELHDLGEQNVVVDDEDAFLVRDWRDGHALFDSAVPDVFGGGIAI
jgi:hypothetical protein